ncbi:Uncharacterised protein [Metamycoplasma arthritidis]|uniref:hypothetical protein n=1 Tax=Metamycoplasma arthritidis TaxID=2111 RepID=UPI0005A53F41|nr:hypothetical protein [Metamycoplasma arthritidis]VEU78994.1 Uncharacterised protein [Metamycoplasma arthritidis]
MKKLLKISSIFIPSMLIGSLALISKSCDGQNTPTPKTDINYVTQLGISIGDEAQNQKSVKASLATKDFLAAKSWADVLSVFRKYQIPYKVDEAPEGATYRVSPGTHPHDDEGIIHLDIIQKIGATENTARFEISGFRTIPIKKEYIIGSYGLSSKAKKADLLNTVYTKLKAAQDKGFDAFLEALREYVDVNKINEQGKKFKFDFSRVQLLSDRGQIIFEKIYTYTKNDQSDLKEESGETIFAISGLKS